MPAGRPTKYKKKYCKQIKEIMRCGASIEEAASEIGVVKSTLYRWAELNPEFSNALKEAVELSMVWWMREGRTSLRDRDFNYTGWYMNMKNRFGWSDKQDINQNVKGSVKITLIDKFGADSD